LLPLLNKKDYMISTRRAELPYLFWACTPRRIFSTLWLPHRQSDFFFLALILLPNRTLTKKQLSMAHQGVRMSFAESNGVYFWTSIVGPNGSCFGTSFAVLNGPYFGISFAVLNGPCFGTSFAVLNGPCFGTSFAVLNGPCFGTSFAVVNGPCFVTSFAGPNGPCFGISWQ